MSDASSSSSNNVPSEFRISEKWDKCIENFTLHFAAGLVAGGLTSVVLARASPLCLCLCESDMRRRQGDSLAMGWWLHG